jgi:hypothetical protein
MAVPQLDVVVAPLLRGCPNLRTLRVIDPATPPAVRKASGSPAPTAFLTFFPHRGKAKPFRTVNSGAAKPALSEAKGQGQAKQALFGPAKFTLPIGDAKLPLHPSAPHTRQTLVLYPALTDKRRFRFRDGTGGASNRAY